MARHCSKLRQLPQVLRGGGEEELVSGALRSAQAQTAEFEDAFEVGEEHLDLLAPMPRTLIGRRVRQSPGHIARILVDVARHLALWRVRTALDLESAVLAVGLARTVEPRSVLGDARTRRRIGPSELHQQLAARAGVVVLPGIEDEVGAREGAVGPVRFVEDGDVRLDLPLLDQPGEVRRRSIGAVGRQMPGLRPKRSLVLSIIVREAPTSACRMARLASTSRMTAFSVSIR